MTDQLSMLSDSERPRETPPETRGTKPLPTHWSARQKRAITSYCRNHGAAPQLSTYPIAYFTEKASGETIKIHADELLNIYDADRKEVTRERARRRRHEGREVKR
jgi:hypothetical protein